MIRNPKVSLAKASYLAKMEWDIIISPRLPIQGLKRLLIELSEENPQIITNHICLPEYEEGTHSAYHPPVIQALCPLGYVFWSNNPNLNYFQVCRMVHSVLNYTLKKRSRFINFIDNFPPAETFPLLRKWIEETLEKQRDEDLIEVTI